MDRFYQILTRMGRYVTLKSYNALNQLGALGVTDAEIVTDNGYYSEPNLSEMLQRGFDFVTLAKTSLKWIRPEIDSIVAERQ